MSIEDCGAAFPEIGFFDLDEEMLAATLEENCTLLNIYRYPGTAVVLGRGSNPDIELDIEACISERVEIVRRRGGGCAVVLDPGNFVISVTIPLPGITGISRAYDMLTEWLTAGLEHAGIAGVHREGTSDLAIGDRKIGGSCIYRIPGLLYYSTTLLVEPEIDKVERYLKHPPREPEYRRRRPHRDFMTSLIEEAGGAENLKDIQASLEERVDLLNETIRKYDFRSSIVRGVS